MAKKSPVRRYLVIPDLHVPFEEEAALRCVLRAIGIIKPDGFINLGDVGEWQAVSYWEWAKKKRPPLDLQLANIDKDIEVVNAALDRIDYALDQAGVKERHFIEGNHDERLTRLVYENPFLERTSHKFGKGYLFKDACRIKERGHKFYPLGLHLKIGHLYFYHGHLHAGIHHARNHLLKMGVNVMYGHWHDIQQFSITHVDGEKSAWCIGCLKRFDHEANLWLNRRPTNWGHGFATVDFFGKEFSVHVHRIINGKVTVYGELIDGNQQKSPAKSA